MDRLDLSPLARIEHGLAAKGSVEAYLGSIPVETALVRKLVINLLGVQPHRHDPPPVPAPEQPNENMCPAHPKLNGEKYDPSPFPLRLAYEDQLAARGLAQVAKY